MAGIKRLFGTKLFQLRTKAGLTQAQLSEKASLSVDSISRMERGERAPSLESLEKIATALKTDPAELLNFKGKELKALAECHPEALELWNLLRQKGSAEIKKVHEVAKVILR